MRFALTCFLLCAAWLASAPACADDLFDPARHRPLTSDHRAQRVGDTLSVLVVENSSASAQADSNLQKESETGIKLATPDKRHDYGLALSSEFSGKGGTLRNGKLLAQLSVTVIGVGENGDLLVSGEQLLEINNDRQSITLEGRVRRADIGSGNTVLSNRLADAKISYVGDGVLGEAQRQGLISRIFGFLGLL